MWLTMSEYPKMQQFYRPVDSPVSFEAVQLLQTQKEEAEVKANKAFEFAESFLIQYHESEIDTDKLPPESVARIEQGRIQKFVDDTYLKVPSQWAENMNDRVVTARAGDTEDQRDTANDINVRSRNREHFNRMVKIANNHLNGMATSIQGLDHTGVEEPDQAAFDGAYEVLQRAVKRRRITPQNIIENVYGFDVNN